MTDVSDTRSTLPDEPPAEGADQPTNERKSKAGTTVPSTNTYCSRGVGRKVYGMPTSAQKAFARNHSPVLGGSAMKQHGWRYLHGVPQLDLHRMPLHRPNA